MNKRQWLGLAAAVVFGPALAAPPQAPRPGNTSPRTRGPNLPAPPAAEVAAWAAECKVPGEPHPLYIVLDGKSAPPAQRRAVLVKLEQCAQRGSISAQNVVGALYWMGDTLPSALVTRDTAKAITYFSNAAAHGDILDMAKLAEIKLANGHTEAAMVWAQLYGHYLSEYPIPHVTHHGLLAALLARIYVHFDPGELPDIAKDANAFIARYDPDIHAYHSAPPQARRPGPALGVRVQPRLLRPQFGNDAQLTDAGFADYLIVFKPDGSVDSAWLLDSFPSAYTGHLLRPAAVNAHADGTAKHHLRFVVMHLIYSNDRYFLRKHR